jgi:hypothetical protein
MHPGNVLEPDYDELVETMMYSYENYEELSQRFFDQVPALTERYNWDRLTENAFSHIVKKFS